MRLGLFISLLIFAACGPPSSADGGVTAGQDAGGAGASDGGGLADAGSAIDAGPVTSDGGSRLGAPGDSTRTISGFPNRQYDLHIPSGYDGVTPLPVVLVLHGGGGDREIAKKTACPSADQSSANCFSPTADRKGFIVVYPDGTSGPAMKFRTWNAGGGDGGWQCVSGNACNAGIDEKAYFTALLTDLKGAVHYDEHRVFATGHSNGAAMSEALACELPDLIAGIAPVAGGNQYSTTRPCTAPTPVLEIHGTDDPCWPFDGGAISCADTNPGSKIGVTATLAGWTTRNGCSAGKVTTMLPDTTNDGTTVLRHAYNCPAGSEVELYEVIGGGHTWPSGSGGANAGTISTDISANQVILDFFAAH